MNKQRDKLYVQFAVVNLQVPRGTACNGRQANEHGTDGNLE